MSTFTLITLIGFSLVAFGFILKRKPSSDKRDESHKKVETSRSLEEAWAEKKKQRLEESKRREERRRERSLTKGTKLQEKQRKVEERKKAKEEKQKALEAKRREEQRRAEEQRQKTEREKQQALEAKRREEQRKAEEERRKAEREKQQALEAKRREEQRKAEEERRKAEREKQQALEAKLQEEQRKAEEERRKAEREKQQALEAKLQEEEEQQLRDEIERQRREMLQILEANGIRYFYHFTSQKNLDSIKRHKGLYAWAEMECRGIPIPCPGGNERSRGLDMRRNLESYVRLSFCQDHPMAFRLHEKGEVLIQLQLDAIKMLEDGILDNAIFSDMNATDNLCKIGKGIEGLKLVQLDSTKMLYLSNDSPDFKYHQAEIMIHGYLSRQYIVGEKLLQFKETSPSSKG